LEQSLLAPNIISRGVGDTKHIANFGKLSLVAMPSVAGHGAER
jgi:hypothetical protein